MSGGLKAIARCNEPFAPTNCRYGIFVLSHGQVRGPNPSGEGEKQNPTKIGISPSPYGFLLALLIHVALSCAASCGAFGATVRTSCSHPLPLPLCRFFTLHIIKLILQHYIVVLSESCPAWRRLVARCITWFVIYAIYTWLRTPCFALAYGLVFVGNSFLPLLGRITSTSILQSSPYHLCSEVA